MANTERAYADAPFAVRIYRRQAHTLGVWGGFKFVSFRGPPPEGISIPCDSSRSPREGTLARVTEHRPHSKLSSYDCQATLEMSAFGRQLKCPVSGARQFCGLKGLRQG